MRHVPSTSCEREAMALLYPTEREYVTGLKRKERSDIARILGTRQVNDVRVPLRIQVLQSRLPEDKKRQIFEGLTRACDKYVTWVKRLLMLPFDKPHPQKCFSDVKAAVKHAHRLMETVITGHDNVKQEVLKLVCQSRTTSHGAPLYSLGLEGPPGVGKTHFAKHCLAPCLDRPLITIPLGGATDSSYLLGSLYVYEGSKEGRLAAALIEAKCINPVIFFDEVDKISTTDRGNELVNVLVHLVDPSANGALRDRYFHGFDLDFSKCTFVFSYNDETKVSPILLDRIKRLKMPAPTDAERRQIVVKHLVPRCQRRLRTRLELSAATVDAILARTPVGVGMRDIERDVEHVFSAAHLCHACQNADGDLLGADGVRVLDEAGSVGVQFAEHVLPRRADDRAVMAMYM